MLDDEFDFDDNGAAPLSDDDLLAALDGPVAEAFKTRKRRLSRVLAGGETGVQFEALALFAEPIFGLYDLDAADAFQLKAAPEAAGDDTVAILETARVLWAFFSLPKSERGRKRQALAAQLVGDDPTAEDWMGLDGLLETVEVHWKALLPEEIEMAQATEHETLGFEELLHHPAFRVGAEADDATHAGFGAAGLSEIEARALFAQPLLEAAETMADADAFENALARADAYWTLAQSAGPDPEADAHAFAASHTETADDAARVAAEAARMIARYRELFPEHAG
ncbi:MAG: hypothetical protein AAF845_20250 [Bacteroidota bacterium]